MKAWRSLSPLERLTLMTLAALHKKLGPHSLFTSDAVALIAGQPVVAELGFLAMDGLVELDYGDGGQGYRLTGPGFDVLPVSEERRALAEHREEADESLRGETR